MPLTAPTITPTVIIPPYEETVVRPVRLRVGAVVQKFGYALELLTEASVTVRAGAAVRPFLQQVFIRSKVGMTVQATLTGSGWTPSSLTTTAWYDAGTSGDFTLDSGTVSQWNDRSGNTRHMTQATSSSKPAYASATQNSLNLVTFDGSNDFLSASALSNFITASAFTVFVVFRHRDTKVGSSDSYSNEAIIADDAGYFGLHTNGPSGIGSIQILGYNWDGTDDSATSVIGANNVWSLLVFTHGSGTLSLYRNGGTATTAASGDTEDLTGTLEMGRSFGGQYQEMDLAEVVVLNSEVSESNRQKLEGYAAHRWGLTSLLPGGHPYKTAGP